MRGRRYCNCAPACMHALMTWLPSHRPICPPNVKFSPPLLLLAFTPTRVPAMAGLSSMSLRNINCASASSDSVKSFSFHLLVYTLESHQRRGFVSEDLQVVLQRVSA